MKKVKRQKRSGVYERIRQILESARAGVSRSVNTIQVAAYWLIGREIVEEEQKGKRRAAYGEKLIADLSLRLTGDFGKGFSRRNLEYFRYFYLAYPHLLQGGIPNAVRSLFPGSAATDAIAHTVRAQFSAITTTPASDPGVRESGRIHANLSWSHYRTLLRNSDPYVRSFYEIESIRNNWSTRELERQMSSLLYERLAMSKDKRGLMRLATQGQEIQVAADVMKDPFVIEFLGLPESPRLVESELEEALINNLQSFLLELGRGFAFVSRQERLTLDSDHFYVDLVFYHTILKCYILIDLKVGKLAHGDLGQLQIYVNYYDEHRRTAGDSPTLGLILCTDKNDAVVRYTLGPHQEKKIFASRYKLHLPTEAELRAELRRELLSLQGGGGSS